MSQILFVTPYYPPDIGAAMVRISETAKRLVKRGHQVSVLTTVPHYPSGIVPPEYRGHLIQREVRDGVRVVRVWSYVSPNKGFLRRILAQFSFACLAPVLGWKEVDHPDVIIVESPPLFDAIAGRVLAWRKHCPFIFTVADLWPEAAIQMGVLRNRVLIRLAEWLEWSTYRRANLVWVVTEWIRDTLIQRGLSPERILLLTNGVDLTKFRPLPKAQARTELGWDDRFTALYAGTQGPSQGLATLIQAAEQLRDRTDIRIVLVGDGASKAELVAEAQRRNLGNVTFLEPQPHDSMPLLLAAADVCLVSVLKVPFTEGDLPSKMFEAMASARPILLGIDGLARRLAEKEAGAAVYFEPENATELVSAILYLREHPEVAELLGQRGRAFAEARFDRDHLTTILEEHIAMLLEKSAPASTSAIPGGVKAITEKG
jgi:putative colanic acid biosynthesis glycosyltransferase WcaI